MAREKLGSGYLSRNKFKKEDHHPEYTGKCKLPIGGKETEVEIGAWIKEKDGFKYFSLSFSADVNVAASSEKPKDDDSVPF